MNHLTLDQCTELKRLGFDHETDFVIGNPYLSSGDWDKTVADFIAGVPSQLNTSKEVWAYKDEESAIHIMNPIACPTLEELILWLGDDFKLVEKRSFPTRYVAWGWKMEDDMPPKEGGTPLEAVYSLAEAIYKPNN